MRREWSDAIEGRRWDELERLAKWEPSQELCDTLAEIENSTTDKDVRKGVRRVLWGLSKAGFVPAKSDASDEIPAETREPLRVAFMMSADAAGDTPITFGHESGGKFKWITAYVHESKGVRRAGTEAHSLEEAQRRIEMLRTLSAPPYLSAEIEPAYALWRIKSALGKNARGTVPEAIAYWRSAIDKATELPHPSEKLKAAKATAAEKSEDVLLMEPTMSWRIELGAATPILEQMYEAQQSHADKGEEAQKEAVKEAGVAARREVLTPEILADHAMRLRDLAFLMNLKGDEGFGKVLSAAQDLEKKGPDSEYAKGLVDKTVVIYVETMKKSEAKGR